MKQVDFCADDHLGNDAAVVNPPCGSVDPMPKAIERALNWYIVAVGKRPKDYIVRDLLLQSVYNDGRQWTFRNLLKQDAAWLLENVSDAALLHKQTKAVRAYMVNHFAAMNDAQARCSGRCAMALSAAGSCWPTMAQVKWRGNGAKTNQNICKQAWICPFCFARNVLPVLSAIEDKLSNRAETTLLVRGVLDLSTSTILPEITRDEVDARFREAGRALQQKVESWGAAGGLRTFAIEPVWERSANWRDGEVVTSEGEAISLRVGIIAEIPEPARTFRQAMADRDTVITLGEDSKDPDWRIGVADDKQCLRRFLYGMKPDGGRSPFEPGVFRWPALNLASAEQYDRIFALTLGRHQYDWWGAWRNARKHCDESKPLGVPQLKSSGWAKLNSERSQATQRRREAKLRDVQPIWIELVQQLGKQPGRRRLIQSLHDAGIEASDRDVRWFTTILKATHGEG